MMRWMIVAIMIAVLTAAKAIASEPVQAIAGIPPAAYLVERIGGQWIRVETLIQPGQDPHTFEPRPRQIQSLEKAKLFFKVGLPFEDQLLEKIRGTQPGLVVVDTTKGIEKRHLSVARAADEGKGDDWHAHGDSPTGLDPHVWLSPPLLKVQAANVAAALEKIDHDHAGFFKANLSGLQQELDALDAKIRLALKPYAGRTFYVYHPAFGYFGDCYQLKQEAVETDGKQPSPGQLRRLIQKAKADGTKVIFVQPQFDQHSAQTVADAIGGRIVSLNDMDKNVIANLQDMAGKMEKAFDETNREK